MDDFCKYCEYRNKPYWSIVSPCVNCIKGKPNLKSNYTITTTTTTNGKTIQINYTDNGDTGDVFVTGLDESLPSAEEYSKLADEVMRSKEWSEPKYICPECGGGMCRNEMYVLTSYPPQYQYQCNKCGYVDCQYI